MGDMSELQKREDALQGLGTSLLRKEDAKFIRGQGSYIDDIKLPGMLFGAIVRSPYAHARIKSIDKAKALACPGVVAVLTADDLKPVNLHWMPTVGADVQAESICASSFVTAATTAASCAHWRSSARTASLISSSSAT